MTKLSTAAQLVRDLIANGDFGHPTTSIKVIETHISWVLLTGEFAYKIKKPVNLGFLDFSELDTRHDYCVLELELNRRFTPELYLEVVSIGGAAGKPVIGDLPAHEWAVRMQQFPAEARLDRQIELGFISSKTMQTFGESLAHLHDQAPGLIATKESGDAINAVSGPVADNFSVLRAYCTDASMLNRLDSLSAWCKQELIRLTDIIQERQTSGRIRECHGDLHLENLVLLDGQIRPFDCIEFDAALRGIDVINEIAFLLMDTLRIDRQDLGFSFLNRYLEISGDYPGTTLLPFYCAYRCLVRAKIAVLREAQSHTSEAASEINRYILLAERIVSREHKPCLIICQGLSGSGKTYLSQQLLAILPAIRIRSDIVRKQLFNLGELESSESEVGTGLYDPTITTQIYNLLAQHSTTALSAGYNVIVDATFLRHADRDVLRLVAKTCAARFVILNCIADKQILTKRIKKRQTNRRDASEADITVLDWQLAHQEPLTIDEQRHVLTIDTGQKPGSNEVTRQLLETAAVVP